MKRTGLVLFISGFWLLVSGFYAIAQETIEILTYYPAPYGVYQTLRVAGQLSRLNSTCNAVLTTSSDTHINLGWNSITGTSGSNINFCTISGGSQNTASNFYATVGGGDRNTASGSTSIIGGGYLNVASGNTATIGGGTQNSASGFMSTIGGGQLNTASNNYSTVSGGIQNTANAWNSTVGGGFLNIASNQHTTVGGGYDNTASAIAATVSGGYQNIVSNSYASVGGGFQNTASGYAATVSGGYYNTASGPGAAIGGGYSNTASGIYSMASGGNAEASDNYSFVWNSYPSTHYSSHGQSTFNVNVAAAYLDGASWSDIAEHMDVLKEEKVSEGEIISIKGYDRLGRSTKPYDDNIIGVISSDRTFTLHLGASAKPYDDTEKLPVTLVGRVFVKVNNENGPIEIGDPITSSSTPGIGMKATKVGKIVGYAMEELNNEEGEILVFVNLGYYVPPEEYFGLQEKIKILESRISLLEEK